MVATSVAATGTEIRVSTASFFVVLEVLIAVVFIIAIDEVSLSLEAFATNIFCIDAMDVVEADRVLDMLATSVVTSGVVALCVTFAADMERSRHVR